MRKNRMARDSVPTVKFLAENRLRLRRGHAAKYGAATKQAIVF